MKFKVDENLPVEVRDQFQNAGHEAATVLDEELGGRPDLDIAEVCKSEERVLVTLDVDFGNIRAYPPENFPGIIVIRTQDQSKAVVLQLVRRIIAALEKDAVSRTLWIVEERRIRVRGAE